jgi:hypothetical protein
MYPPSPPAYPPAAPRPAKRRWPWVILAIVLGLMVIGMLKGLDGQDGAGVDPAGLHILHRSTFDHLSEDGNGIAMLFGDGRKAVVADNIWKNRRLFLVDLAAGSERELPLDRTDLSLHRFVYADDEILAIFTDQNRDTVVYRISAEGELRPFEQYREGIILMQGSQPSEDVQNLFAAGELENLTNLQEEVCEFDGSSYDTDHVLTEFFYNERTIVYVNVDDLKALLRPNTTRTVVNRCIDHLTERDAPVEISLTHRDNVNTGASDLDTPILKAEIRRDGALLKSLSFDPQYLYFYVVPVGERLYFVGNNVSYLELDE